MKNRYEQGHIIAVSVERLGSQLVGDHTAGVTSVTVEDAADFDEKGGSLEIDGQVLEYTDVDDDTGVITFASGVTLPVAASQGDRVNSWNTLYGVIDTDKTALVEVDGDDGDPRECSIAHHLIESLTDDIRGLRGESVKIEQDDDEWVVVDVLGLSDDKANARYLFTQETFILPVDGAQTIELTHEPIKGSEHVYWFGLYQEEGDAWTSDEDKA